MTKNIFFSVSRWVIILALVLSLIPARDTNRISNADPETVVNAITASMDMGQMLPGDNQLIKRFYGLDPAAFASCTLYYPTTNMMAEELLVVKLQDVSQQQMVKEAIEKRIETQKNTFEGYGVEQFQLLTEHAVIEIQGNYILFVVSPDSEAVRQAFLKAL